MQYKSVSIILSAFLLLCVTKVSEAQLQCYICTDCEHITANTPQKTCDAEYFNNAGTTLPSTMTTTNEPTSTSLNPDDTTLMTTESVETTSPNDTTEETTISTSTEALPPTPPTAGPPQTTTPVPTPPVVSSTQASPNDDAIAVNNTVQQNNTAASAELYFVRQRRSAMTTNVTYHCYWVNKHVNGSTITERGCGQIEAHENLCKKLQNENNDITLNNCYPCSNNLCNGSSALKISALAIILGVFAIFLNRT